jgi:hypothetical protein
MVAAMVLAASLGIPAFAQSSASSQSSPTPNAQVQTGASASGTSNGMNPNDNSTYATGQPLPTKSNEGFWGHMNPFARKKWVNRQLSPVKDRLNELDQLTAKNANDIKDVDSRAQAGIHQAQSTADQANQTAQSASSTANQAQTVAQQASTQTSKLNTTVAGLDQFQQVTSSRYRDFHGLADRLVFRIRSIWRMPWFATSLPNIRFRSFASIRLRWATPRSKQQMVRQLRVVWCAYPHCKTV